MNSTQLLFAIMGSVVGFATLTITSLGIMLRRSEKRGVNANRLDGVEIKVNGLKCNEHIQSVNSMHVDMESLRGDIKMMMSHMGIGKNIRYAMQQSPMQLTPKGEEFVAEYSLDSMIYRKWEYIKKLISDKGFTTAYDIDKFCYEQALLNPDQFFVDDDLTRMKGIAFLRGERLEEYASMIAVIVRNKYFDENGISIADVESVSHL